MAEYWKSQDKKFCDFCKCWIADNKPSIGFHESGKRHKENVTKRLSEISKNSRKSYKEGLQLDKEMKKMEEDAYKAYMKDLKENPDYTSKQILEETERKTKELEESVKQQKESSVSTDSEFKKKDIPAPVKLSQKLWYEAKSDEGFTYYWNINTSESKWEPPEEGFLSIEEQEKEQKEVKFKEEFKQRKKEEKAKQKNANNKGEPTKKKRKKAKENEDVEVAVGPAPKPDPYGAWTVIEKKVEEPLDLQLPEQEYIPIKVPEYSEPEIKFKEKTISSLTSDDCLQIGFKKEIEDISTTFKKRKFNRGNIRQKLDTE